MTSIRLSAPAARVHRTRVARRTIRRLMRDPHALLAVGLVLITLTIAFFGDRADVERTVAVSIEFLAAQLVAAMAAPFLHPSKRQRLVIGIARFVLAILYVSVVTGLLRQGDFRPAGALFIPVVALAAAEGAWPAILVGLAAIALYFLPIASATPDTLGIDAQRAIALGGTAVLLSIGTRRSISNLTVTVRRLGTSLARDRRRSRQVAAVESVGRLLAATGPEPAALERIVSLLREDLGYDFVSVYLGNSSRMRLAVQRGYAAAIEEFDGTSGVLGRVMRTRELAFVPDIAADPDYRSADSSVRSEISAPLLVDNEVVGIVNVEARWNASLDLADVETVRLVAERLASALALAGERERLAARADLFRRLTSFAAAVNGTLDPDRLNEAIVGEVRSVLAADSVVLTVLDRPSGQYLLRAVAPSQPEYLGRVLAPGDGLAGRAIRDRALVVDDRFDPARSAILRSGGDLGPPMAGAAVPLIRDDVVVGALTLLRSDVRRPFAPDELEALPIVAGLVALAITNTFLHAEVTELSVRDALTGLFNRRYLDATVGRLEAGRQRRSRRDRERVAAIMFDLDHFGAMNKQHGHQTGDAILRAFADILRARFRGADLVARYGGEEFLAILDGATVDQATVIAEEIRSAFRGVTVAGPDGSPVSATVSAG
ncbi:MAG TPA: sensor domain-containing diguanylate cyclase, partial [Candidatus Limnocylindrales bacterium]|nr:sensor domain-containing diguanylate cyclase [Candidatus Limnocylindrales bacterium]